MVVRGRHLRVAARDAKTFLHLGRPTLHVFPPVCMSVERMKARRFLHLGPPFCISGSQPCMSANQFRQAVTTLGTIHFDFALQEISSSTMPGCKVTGSQVARSYGRGATAFDWNKGPTIKASVSCGCQEDTDIAGRTGTLNEVLAVAP